MSIVSIVAREILDSRGNPTVEVDLSTEKGDRRPAYSSEDKVKYDDVARARALIRQGLNCMKTQTQIHTHAIKCCGLESSVVGFKYKLT